MANSNFMHSYNSMLKADALMERARKLDAKVIATHDAMLPLYQQAYAAYTLMLECAKREQNTSRELMAQSNLNRIKERIEFFHVRLPPPNNTEQPA